MRWEKEFFRLAGTYLSCRQEAMGPGDLAFHALGMRDYASEMRLVLVGSNRREDSNIVPAVAKP